MSVASKNLYDLLGNDDGDDTPRAPVKTVDKPVARTTKRNAEPEAPARLPAGGAGNRRGGASGSDAAFRDRNTGSDRNRGRSTEEAAKGGARGGFGARGRGGKWFFAKRRIWHSLFLSMDSLLTYFLGRGGRFPRERDDRHTKGLPSGSEKQAAQSWGATEGNAELKDEQAGEAIAEAEKKDVAAEDAEEKVEEPEEKHVSYNDYLTQLAEKKAQLDSTPEIRKANEGSSKKWGNAQEVVREDADYMPASGGKAKRERTQKAKEVIDIDLRYVEPERPQRGGYNGERGSRGGRGGRGRGDRGDRGGERGRGGNFRGGERADRGGGRKENNAAINTKDESAFPSLGGK
ncbi:hypothetical protein ACHAQH_005236 [Verticillium albo-atrum]